jgi:hypothetical protein
MSNPVLPDSAAAYFRELERRLLQAQMPAPIAHGPVLPDAGERANQLFVLEGVTHSLYYSDGSAWHAV